ncbi:transcriptional regulator, GntR family [Franzmannia pantelleriensis]|uniref:Transcriptional regulator, GntR family n=1 Tax=Franzmannia pantelleriensis TaxID=48727 RepID=A0A1G9R2N6_9GAMM|nr:FCD domain-containing protein [Halomonas pantelleriensis]SDM17391.1 transcriptional regulator, GntR family [Halomonas pantelleriensis]
MSEKTLGKAVRADGARSLARYLQQQIESGNFPAGHRLPTERELSERFAASRGAVRRVLGNFKQQGLITQVVGSGTFVSEQVSELVPQREEPVVGARGVAVQTSPAQLMEARLLIEPQMVALIVRYATASDFERMDECIVRSEAATAIEAFEHWDGALHQAFAEATHNSFFLRILELTNVVREEGEWGRLKRVSLTPERRKRYEMQHRAIVAALRDRDEDTARALLEEHLREVQKNLFGRN